MSWDQNQGGFDSGYAQQAEPAVSGDRPRPVPGPDDDARRNYKWASNRARYEFNENAVGEDGMAPRDAKLESELFEQDAADQQTTLDFSRYESIPIRVERGSAPPPLKSFDDAALHPIMKDNVRLAKYSKPTPVQTFSVPIVLAGKDLMACAQTGSGKTAAFLIPTLSSLFGRAKELAKPRPAPYETRRYKAEPLVLIVAPTRELCSQIFDECRRFTYRSSLRPCAVYGGADTISQLNQLERGCDILAAAPGRLMDFIERGKIGLERVKYLVLDEADRMLDMGFEAIIRNIVTKRGLNPDRQTLMFSATFPRAIRALARDFLRPDYLFLKVGRVGGTTSSITQKVIEVQEDEKREKLRELLNSQPPSRTLIFVETKRSADSLDQYLYDRSFPSTSIHGDRTQMEREDALLAFKSGQCPILVATAVAARGIDIRNVMHVINYDMPKDMDEYIHRIGRTARVGKSGLATSFYNYGSEMLAPELTKLLQECQQEVPDFLEPYKSEDKVWDEDLDDQEVSAPSYAGQEWVPQENSRGPPGAAGENGEGGHEGGNAGGNQDGGDWECPGCSVSNFSRRFECFKCQTPRPEGLGGGQERPPRQRREGDWDCSACGISNFASRVECFKCSNPKEGGAGGDSYGGYDNSTSGFESSTANWDSNTTPSWGQTETADTSAPATGGWGQSEPAAAPATGGWGQSEPVAAPAAPATGGWGQSEPAAPAAPAATSGGWGQPEPAAPATVSGGWGQPEPAAAAPAPAAPAASGGWGQSETTAPATGGWGQPEPAAAKPVAAPAAGGWGQPTPAAPASAAGGWGQTETPAPAPAVQATGGWEAAVPPPSSNGWGQSAPAPASEPKPAAAPTPAPAPAPAVSNGGGWGTPEVQAGGWGAPPANTGNGWN